MKRIIIATFFVLSGLPFFGQTTLPQISNFVVGLPTASETELNLIKENFANEPRVAFAEFISKDKILMIEVDPKRTPYLTFADVEESLLQYFQKSDIHQKVVDSFKALKAEHSRDDKFIIK